MRVTRRSLPTCNLFLSLSQGFHPVHTIEPKTLLVKKNCSLVPFLSFPECFMGIHGLWMNREDREKGKAG